MKLRASKLKDKLGRVIEELKLFAFTGERKPSKSFYFQA